MIVSSVNVHMPKDRVTQAHQGYGFVEFMGEEDADYAIKIMNMIKLFGKPIRVNKVIYLQKCVCMREKYKNYCVGACF
jgi:splicing factor 3B subunit 4